MALFFKAKLHNCSKQDASWWRTWKQFWENYRTFQEKFSLKYLTCKMKWVTSNIKKKASNMRCTEYSFFFFFFIWLHNAKIWVHVFEIKWGQLNLECLNKYFSWLAKPGPILNHISIKLDPTGSWNTKLLIFN